MTTPPPQPPEGALLELARKRHRPKKSVPAMAALAGMSETRWRQIEKGYLTPSAGTYAPVRAPAETLARMAYAAHVTPDKLREVDRADAADAYERLMGTADDAPPLEATKIEVEGFEALEIAVKGTPPEHRELALRIALKAVEAFQQESGSQPKDPEHDA